MISSCSKALDEPGYPGFRCAFGNAEYIADSATYKTRQAGVIGTNIYAYSGGKVKFKFFLQTADTTGTISLDSFRNTAYYYAPDSTVFRSISGSLNISQYYNDSLKMVSGSFNFNGRVPGSSGNSLNFTYGYFNNIPRRN
jgi:hypothetical protein